MVSMYNQYHIYHIYIHVYTCMVSSCLIHSPCVFLDQVLFISHQWLGAKAPDPSGQQLFVLRQALKRFMDKSLLVEEDLTRMFRSFHNATSYEQARLGPLGLS